MQANSSLDAIFNDELKWNEFSRLLSKDKSFRKTGSRDNSKSHNLEKKMIKIKIKRKIIANNTKQ